MNQDIVNNFIRCEMKNIIRDERLIEFYKIVKYIEYISHEKVKKDYKDVKLFTYIKEPEDLKYPPSIKVKLPFSHNRYDVEFYDGDDRTTSSSLMKDSIVRLSLTPKEVWTNKEYCGVYWVTKKVVII